MANNSVNGRRRLHPREFGYSEFSLRIWHGMTLPVWLRIVSGNINRISLKRIPLVISICLFALFNSIMAMISTVTISGRADRHKIKEDPVFVLGFWRSGTTLLHDLLVTDPRHAYPTLFQCLCPDTFLVTSWLANVIDRFLPDKRPMDGMSASVHVPQEDEFAILNMGLKTPYRFLAFTSHGAGDEQQHRYWPEDEAEWLSWHQRWLRFLRHVSWRNSGRRLVLKSPPHTGRVGEILKQFPNAKFVHISRSPDQLITSNLKMNRAMAATQSLEADVDDDATILSNVLTVHKQIYEAYFRDIAELGPDQLLEIRYEDLVDNPANEMRNLYERLKLGASGEAAKRTQKLMDARARYQADQYRSKATQESDGMLGEYARRFGYSVRK
jgi:hypothetical protein